MSDMRVKLFLELVNRLSPGAKAAARDLKSIKQAAGELKREKGGEALAAGLNKVAPAGRKAAREVRAVKNEARQLAGERGPQQLAGTLDKAAGSASRLRRELEATKRAQRDFARSNPLGSSAGGSSGRGGRGLFSRTGGGAGAVGGSGVGLAAAAAAAGRATAAAGGAALLPLAAAYGGYRGAGAVVRGTVGTSISREKSMAEVKKKVDLPDGKSWEALEKQISAMSIRYGRSFDSIAAIVAEAGASNIDFGDLPRFTKLATKAAIGWDMDPREAAQKLFEIRSQHQMTIQQLEELADVINDQEDSSAAKARDLVEMFQRAGEAGEISGVDKRASLAFLTAIRSGGMQPEVGARMFAAFTGGLRTITDGSKKAKEALKELGLDPAKVEKGMQTDAAGTIVDLFDRLEKNKDQAKKARDIFGKEWWDDVLRAKKVMPEFLRLLDRARDPKAYNGSLEKALNVELDTTASHLEQIKEAAGEIGNRLGKWALPPIKEAIKGALRGFEELERRAAERQENEALAQKKARGEALTPEERQKLAEDRERAYAVERRGNRLSSQKDYAETAARNADVSPETALDERRRLLHRQRQRQIETLEAQQRLSPDTFGLGSQLRLKALRRQLDEIPYSPSDSSALSGDSAARSGDGKADRSKVLALQEQVRTLDRRIQAIDDLASLTKNPADRSGFRADALSLVARRAETEAMLRRQLAPTIAALGNFNLSAGGGQGKGWRGGKPANWAGRPDGDMPATGPGLLSFGLNGAHAGSGGWNKNPGAAWAEKVKSDFDIDLGPAGMTMMERLDAGFRSGVGKVEASAAALKSNVVTALSGADASSAGQAFASTFAAGINAGTPAVVAAAQNLAAKAKGALGSGGGRGLGGALHDGVD